MSPAIRYDPTTDTFTATRDGIRVTLTPTRDERLKIAIAILAVELHDDLLDDINNVDLVATGNNADLIDAYNALHRYVKTKAAT